MVITVKNCQIHLFPILHGRLEFAKEVRARLLELRPEAIAVELPHNLYNQAIKAVKRLPLLSVLLYEAQDGNMVYFLVEPQDCIVEAVRYGVEEDVPVYFVDLEVEGYPQKRQAMPDPYAISGIGYESYVETYLTQHSDKKSERHDALRETFMAYNLGRISEKHRNIAFVFGLSHYPAMVKALEQPTVRPLAVAEKGDVSLAQLHPESSREVLSEMPLLCARYEQERKDPGELRTLDRLLVHDELLEAAASAHEKNSKERVTLQQKMIFHRFVRNYSFIQGHLSPSFYQLVIAARGAVDDNFAYELWELGSEYPWQDESEDLPKLRIRGDDLYLNNQKIRFHRRKRFFRRRLVPMPVKKRIREKRPGEWKEQWRGDAFTCSFPPEDIVVEGFGDYLKKKAVRLLSEEHQRVLPFSTSLMDGINVRETIRNWTERKIYVNANAPVKGKVGSVVIIFDDDLPGEQGKERYPWKLTWLGEHQQESDMALYATPPGEMLVGPGISRCHHGGFMLTYPPFRLLDVWTDPFFESAATKPEKLLMAALDYSVETNVVYVAAKPPSARMRSFAERLGKKVIYMPIGFFSPPVLKRMRTFHVLDGHEVRRYAKEYIGI